MREHRRGGAHAPERREPSAWRRGAHAPERRKPLQGGAKAPDRRQPRYGGARVCGRRHQTRHKRGKPRLRDTVNDLSLEEGLHVNLNAPLEDPGVVPKVVARRVVELELLEVRGEALDAGRDHPDNLWRLLGRPPGRPLGALQLRRKGQRHGRPREVHEGVAHVRRRVPEPWYVDEVKSVSSHVQIQLRNDIVGAVLSWDVAEHDRRGRFGRLDAGAIHPGLLCRVVSGATKHECELLAGGS
mmetsp:Transcript_151542/g.486295  ORF Transcript_151542/g.486295 Transcript_151542/m.486295 type:complete len:242 (-) Transcript_151542:41-766(-)